MRLSQSNIMIDLHYRPFTSCTTTILNTLGLIWVALMDLQQWCCYVKLSVNFSRFQQVEIQPVALSGRKLHQELFNQATN